MEENLMTSPINQVSFANSGPKDECYFIRKPSYHSTLASTLEDLSSDDETELYFPFPTSKQNLDCFIQPNESFFEPLDDEEQQNLRVLQNRLINLLKDLEDEIVPVDVQDEIGGIRSVQLQLPSTNSLMSRRRNFTIPPLST